MTRLSSKYVMFCCTGLLLTATDSVASHVNGTHIEFSQRGDLPSSQQPLFVVYTDQGN